MPKSIFISYTRGNEFYRTKCHYSATEVKNVKENSNGQSDLGVAGLVGNIWEWCGDSKIRGVQTFLPMYRNSPNPKMVRGGSFKSMDEDDLVLTEGKSCNGDNRYDDVGFRIVLAL